MPRTALRCQVDINVHAITCPGVWLPRRDDVFISVSLFNELRQTQITSPIFPLLLHDKFRFDRVLYNAFEPAQVADALQGCTVLIELIQMSDIYEGGRLLAWYETDAKSFLYPYPTYSACYGTQDREVLLTRTLDFPGIAPKLQFSTHTVLKETSVPLNTYDVEDYGSYSGRASSRRSRSRSRSRSRMLGYSQPTISSITRGRSLSPSLSRRLDALDLTTPDLRPPFVVRKVGRDLIGRIPAATPGRECAHSLYSTLSTVPITRRSRSSSVGHYLYDDDLNDYTYRPASRISQVVRDSGSYHYPVYSSRYNYFSDPDSDLGLEASGYYTTPRSTSPYRSSLSDRYSERPWSQAKSDVISSRVERALRRNRSMERLDRLTSSYNDWSY